MMNANSRFLNEAKQLEARWSETGLLDDINDHFVRSCTAVLLHPYKHKQTLCRRTSCTKSPTLTPTTHSSSRSSLVGRDERGWRAQKLGEGTD